MEVLVWKLRFLQFWTRSERSGWHLHRKAIVNNVCVSHTKDLIYNTNFFQKQIFTRVRINWDIWRVLQNKQKFRSFFALNEIFDGINWDLSHERHRHISLVWLAVVLKACKYPECRRWTCNHLVVTPFVDGWRGKMGLEILVKKHYIYSAAQTNELYIQYILSCVPIELRYPLYN